MAVEKRWLVKAIREILIPQLTGAGFQCLPLSDEDLKSREFRTTDPFGRLRRARADVFEQIEIQFAPRGRAAFRLNLGFVPLAGVTNLLGEVHASEAWVHDLKESAELRPRLGWWFRVRRWPWQSTTEEDYQRLVKHVWSLTGEVEGYFRSEQPTPHIRRIRE